MSFSSEIIKSALLGTDKYSPKVDAALGADYEIITQNQEDKEDAFLKLAFSALLYEECGTEFRQKQFAESMAPREEKTYASPKFNAFLRRYLQQNDDQMLDFCLKQLIAKNQLVAPDIIPSLFNKVNKNNRKDISAVCGHRGVWLCTKNKNWQNIFVDHVELENFETANFESRKALLTDLRNSDPEKVIELVKTFFGQENAQKRLEIVELFEINSGLYDEAFLNELLQDRSTKVVQKAIEILKGLVGSEVNKAFTGHLCNVLAIKEERVMLISKRKVLDIKVNVKPNKLLFDFGLEAISSEKGFDDHLFWFAQCLVYTPPQVLEKNYNVNKSEWLKLFLAHKDFLLVKPYLIQWIAQHKDAALAQQWLNEINEPNLELIKLLDTETAKRFYNKYLEVSPGPIINYLLQIDWQMDETMAILVIRALKKAPYLITAAQYRDLAFLLPISLKPQINELAMRISDGHFELKFLKNQLIEMVRILEMREHLND